MLDLQYLNISKKTNICTCNKRNYSQKFSGLDKLPSWSRKKIFPSKGISNVKREKRETYAMSWMKKSRNLSDNIHCHSLLCGQGLYHGTHLCFFSYHGIHPSLLPSHISGMLEGLIFLVFVPNWISCTIWLYCTTWSPELHAWWI